MSRTLHAAVIAALTLFGSVAASCGRPTPGEMPPLAPRPEPIDPAGKPTGPDPVPGVGGAARDAGVELPRGPVATVSAIPVPEIQSAGASDTSMQPSDAEPIVEPPTNVNAPADAGVVDSYTPPLPPVPDAGLPDSRLEPH